LAHISHAQRPRRMRGRQGGLLLGPLALFVAVTLIAAGYVAYTLWPRWPGPPASLDAPALPVMVAGEMFNLAPAAIRQAVQRKPGSHERIDLVYLWPGLAPPDPAQQPTLARPVDPNDRLFLTIASGETTLPIEERAKTIYPRYSEAAAGAGPPGLTVRPFRDHTPYAGEDLVYEPTNPERFLARCTRKGVGNSGTCMLERRVGNADLTFRFSRDWLTEWDKLADGIERLITRLHPAAK